MVVKYNSLEEVLDTANKAKGKKVRDFIIEEDWVTDASKGSIGHIIEKNLFGLELNNRQVPDFEELGIELKVTGYRWVYSGKKVSAKERLVITMIDYFKDISIDFYDSHLYSKIKKMVLMLYEYEDRISYRDFIFTHNFLYEFEMISEKDKMIILKDWQKIINKIRNGEAHNLSEGDTMYLGAAPKGANKKSLVKQPFSDELAMARAYSLKTTYMTYILRNQIFNKVESKESLIKDLNLLKNSTIEEVINQLFEPYRNKTLTEIDELIGEKLDRKDNKQLMKSYTSRMLKISESNYKHIEEFEKANIQIKTITLEENGNLKEHMSFPSMDFIKVSNETWLESEIRDYFESTKFLFIIYQKVGDDSAKERIFLGSFLWNMPSKIIDQHIYNVWSETHEILNSSIDIVVKGNRIYNNFPKQKNNPVAHVRPHGSLRSTTKNLPTQTKINILENDDSVDLSIFFDNHMYTAMSFWLNRTYILNLLKNNNLL